MGRASSPPASPSPPALRVSTRAVAVDVPSLLRHHLGAHVPYCLAGPGAQAKAACVLACCGAVVGAGGGRPATPPAFNKLSGIVEVRGGYGMGCARWFILCLAVGDAWSAVGAVSRHGDQPFAFLDWRFMCSVYLFRECV